MNFEILWFRLSWLTLGDWRLKCLFFFIGSSNRTTLLKIIISWNLLCCFFPICLIRLTVDTTLSPIKSLVPSWISSFDSSGSKGFPRWLNAFINKDTCFANFSSWWWNSECSVSFNIVESSNCETVLATSGLQISHLQNLSSSSVNSRIPPYPRKKGYFPKHFYKRNIT